MKTLRILGMSVVILAMSNVMALAVDTGLIAFTSNRDGNNNIYTMNMDGSNQTCLANDPGDDIMPVFSPNGQKIAFFSNRSGSYQIYTMGWDGSELQVVPNTQCNPGNTCTGPGLSWSPDGTQLLFKPTSASLATVNLDGTNKTILTTGGAPGGRDYIEGVHWAPNATNMFVSAHATSNGFIQEIFKYTISPPGWTQITHGGEPPISFGPQVSPNGTRIAYGVQASHRYGYEIWTMDLDGTERTQLTNFGSPNLSQNPAWVGNNQLVYASNRTTGGTNSPFQIWLMDTSGENQKMLSGAGSNFLPSYSPVTKAALVKRPEKELIFQNLWVSSPDISIRRAKVVGGWLVISMAKNGSEKSITFYPDPKHEWDGGSME